MYSVNAQNEIFLLIALSLLSFSGGVARVRAGMNDKKAEERKDVCSCRFY